MERPSSSHDFKFETPLVDKGVKYESIETYYQAMKVSDRDLDLRRWIASLSPSEARQAGQRLDGLRRLALEEERLSRADEAQRSRIAEARREIVGGFPEDARALAEQAQMQLNWQPEQVLRTAIEHGFPPGTVDKFFTQSRSGGGQRGHGITVTGSQRDEYARQLQKKLSFQVQVNPETHKVEIIENGKALNDAQLDALGKRLSGADRAAFDAITDKQHHVTIDTGNGRDDPSVFFGREMGATHKIDFADLAKLDRARVAISGADVVLHETLEAHAQAKGVSYRDAHNYALEFAPALGTPRRSRIQEHFDARGRYTGTTTPRSIDGKIDNGRPTHLGFVNIKVEFPSPIPRGSEPPRDARIVEVSREARTISR